MRNEPGVHVTALIVIACLLGGGGVAYGLSNLVVQLVALVLLAINRSSVGAFFLGRQGTLARGLTLLVLATLALPLVQLVPLPAGSWESLPGRALLQESLAAIGQSGWHSTSVSQARTLVAFLGLIAPFTLLILTIRGNSAMMERSLLVFVGMGVAGVLLGALQIRGGENTVALYSENPMPGVLFGLFANRNSTAIFFVCCLLLLCGRPASRLFSISWIATASAAALLTVGVVLTQSRTGLVLLALPLGLALLRAATAWVARARRSSEPGNAARTILAGTLAIVVVGLGVAGAGGVLPQSRFDTVLDRFNRSEEQRPAIWEDARYAAQRYWPVGSGMGTFDEVFQIDESLENITPRRAGRAHNDYIEIAIEAGIAGFVLIGLWALWTFAATWFALGQARRWEALAGTGILLAVALQSLVDYPLRNQSMLCLSAFAIALLARAARTEDRAFADNKADQPEGAAA